MQGLGVEKVIMYLAFASQGYVSGTHARYTEAAHPAMGNSGSHLTNGDVCKRRMSFAVCNCGV